MAESVRRLDPGKRSIRQLMADQVFTPLGMKDSALGVRSDLRDRHVVPDLRGNVPAQHLGHSNYGPDGAFEEEHAEMPWVGAISTVPDLLRYAQMLQAGGRLEGARLVSRAMLDQATINRTGEKPNELLRHWDIRAAGNSRPPTSGWASFCEGGRLPASVRHAGESPHPWAPGCRQRRRVGRSRPRVVFRHAVGGRAARGRQHRAVSAAVRHGSGGRGMIKHGGVITA